LLLSQKNVASASLPESPRAQLGSLLGSPALAADLTSVLPDSLACMQAATKAAPHSVSTLSIENILQNGALPDGLDNAANSPKNSATMSPTNHTTNSNSPKNNKNIATLSPTNQTLSRRRRTAGTLTVTSEQFQSLLAEAIEGTKLAQEAVPPPPVPFRPFGNHHSPRHKVSSAATLAAAIKPETSAPLPVEAQVPASPSQQLSSSARLSRHLPFGPRESSRMLKWGSPEQDVKGSPEQAVKNAQPPVVLSAESSNSYEEAVRLFGGNKLCIVLSGNI
jgi:hypothetical protein